LKTSARGVLAGLLTVLFIMGVSAGTAAAEADFSNPAVSVSADRCYEPFH
jgi:hypothetical protein